MRKTVLSILISIILISCETSTKKKNYSFDGSISQEVLVNYLSRAVTFNGLSFSDTYEDDIRLLKNIQAKFVGRVSYIWNNETDYPDRSGQVIDPEDLFKKAEAAAKILHDIDPEIIAQACVFEIVDSFYVSKIKIPERVFLEFELEPEDRNFRYRDMLYSDGLFYEYWSKSRSVPDLSKLETRMFWFYITSNYIDLGYEAIHCGQIQLMNRADTNNERWFEMINRIRRYAKKNARRHMVLFDAHVTNGGFVSDDGHLLFDFHSFPQRPVEVCETPYNCVLEVGFHDAIYQRSKGGITPSGWKCESLPYIVEFDNSGMGENPGECVGPDWIWPWGWEECYWFAHCSPEYRAEWLAYVVTWLHDNDPAGHLQMPVKIPTEDREPNGKRIWYRANTKSDACPLGYGDEEAIKAAWELLD